MRRSQLYQKNVNSHNLFVIGTMLITIGPILLTIALAKDFIQPYLSFHDSIPIIIFIIGFILIDVGILLLIIHSIYSRKNISEYDKQPYSCYPIEEHRLDELYRFCITASILTEDDFVPIEVWKSRYKVNNHMFFVQEIQKKIGPFYRSEEIVATCIITPINNVAKFGLDQGEMSGLDIMPEHIVKKNKVPAAYYLTLLMAVDMKSSASIIRFMYGYFVSKITDHGSISVYTKPINDMSLSIVKKHNFKPVENTKGSEVNSSVYYRTITKGELRDMKICV